jgi:hypothetical protein
VYEALSSHILAFFRSGLVATYAPPLVGVITLWEGGGSAGPSIPATPNLAAAATPATQASRSAGEAAARLEQVQ